MPTLPPSEWIERCVERIGQIDSQMAENEARELALDLSRFERTAAMEPEAAVDFVADELARPGHRFERRTVPRT